MQSSLSESVVLSNRQRQRKKKGNDQEIKQSNLTPNLILNYFMAYRVYLSDYLPLDIGTTAAYLSTGANQFALKILKLFI